MTRPQQDLTASRWASPEVRREREFQTRAWTPTPPSTQQPGFGCKVADGHSQTRSHSYAPDPILSLNPLLLGSTPPPPPPGTVNIGGATVLPTTAATNTKAGIGAGQRAGASPHPTLPPTTTTTTSPALSLAQRQYLARQTELQRFRRLFRRLAWKANSLTHWSHRALSLAQEYQNQQQQQQQRNHEIGIQHGHPTNGHHHPHPHPQAPPPFGPRATLGRYEMVIDPIEAERQFKIDFFEFYALLERGLVCLLGVWGVVITSTVTIASNPTLKNSGTSTGTGTGPSRQWHHPDSVPSIIGDSRTFHGAAHRFHANVLDALDHPSNPLHDVLGAASGDVRAYIGVAKEFRNKWKDVEQRPDDSFLGPDRAEEEWDRAKVKRYEKVLQDLRLDELLGTVLAGLEEAGRRAEAEVSRLETMLGNSATTDARNSRRAVAGDDGDFDMLDAPFETSMGGERVDRDDYEMEL